MMPMKTISTRKLLSLITDSVRFRCSTIMRIVGHHLLSIAYMTTALNFTSGRSSMVFSSTLITLSMRITVNSFEKIQRLYLRCLESCCSLNQIQKMRRKMRIYCLITSMFFPWCEKRTPKSSDESWQQFVQANQENLSPHIRRIIYNLTLLHKSKEETLIHQMQLRAQEESSDDDFDDSSTVASHDFIYLDSDLGDDENFSASTHFVLTTSLLINSAARLGVAEELYRIQGYLDHSYP